MSNAPPYSAGAVANYIIGRSQREHRPVSHVRLQGLVYVSYGMYYAIANAPLFGEPFEAWPHGPIVPSLHHEFKRFGPAPIHSWSTEYNYMTERNWFPVIPDDASDVLALLDAMWHRYSLMDLNVLIDHVRQPGGPWSAALSGGQRYIDPQVIAVYYRGVLNDWRQQAIGPYPEGSAPPYQQQRPAIGPRHR